jgi:hypothetical protein
VLYIPTLTNSLTNALKVRFSPSQQLSADINAPLNIIQAILEANLHVLLNPNPDGRMVTLHAMKVGASPDIIHTMMAGVQPSMLVMRLIHREYNKERGNLLIHDMLMELGVPVVQEDLAMAYLKIVADKET